LLLGAVGLAQGSLLPHAGLTLERAGLGSSAIGLILASHALGLTLALPLTGPALARLGARTTLMGASGVAALLILLARLPLTPPTLTLALVLGGISLGLVFNLVEAWVNSLLPEASRGRWLAVHCTFYTLCQLAGPLVLDTLGGPAALGLAALGLLLSIGLAPRQGTPLEEDETASPEPWHHWLREAPAILWGTGLFALFDALILGILPLYLIQQGQLASVALGAASLVLAGDCALEWVMGWLADRLGRLPIQLGCGIGLLGCALLLPTSLGTPWASALLFLLGGCAGGIYVLAVMSAGQRYSGARLVRITALQGAVWGLAGCIGPALTGQLLDLNPRWALPGVLAGGSLLLLITLALEHLRARPPVSTHPSAS
jgi:MFS family permease